MIFSIAWKNVWRNKLRSSIVIASIIIGLVGVVFYRAFAIGMTQQQINFAIKTQTSNIQIHHPKYLINNEIKYAIDNPNKKLKEIKNISGVVAAASRIVSPAMISSAVTGTGIFINGIDVENEKKISNLHSLLTDGKYFDSKLKKPIMISKKLAEKLNVKIKSKVVVTIQSTTEDITYEAFRVVGIYETNNTNYDLTNVFVLKKDLAKVLEFSNSKATEIAVLLKHNDMTDSVAEKINKLFNREISDKILIVRTWKEVQPFLEMLNKMTAQFAMIFVVIILVALSFGIINTMLMAIMERVREIGMLMAIGMNKSKIFLMIMLETVLLSFTGGIVGLLITWVLVEITSKTGIDLSSFAEGLNSFGYGAIVYPELEYSFYILMGVLVIITAILASIMPSRKALKFNPAEAVRHDA